MSLDVVDEDDEAPDADVWMAVHPDARTDTLVVLAQSGVLLLSRYSTAFRSGGLPEAHWYTFPISLQVLGEDEPSHTMPRHALPQHWTDLVGDAMPAQLAVHDGRAVVVHGLITMLDLTTPTPLALPCPTPQSASREPYPSGLAPLAVYEWSDVLDLGVREGDRLCPQLRSSCVQMDSVRGKTDRRAAYTMCRARCSRRSPRARHLFQRTTKRSAGTWMQLWSLRCAGTVLRWLRVASCRVMHGLWSICKTSRIARRAVLTRGRTTRTPSGFRRTTSRAGMDRDTAPLLTSARTLSMRLHADQRTLPHHTRIPCHHRGSAVTLSSAAMSHPHPGISSRLPTPYLGSV